jgi:hypothetical protein
MVSPEAAEVISAEARPVGGVHEMTVATVCAGVKRCVDADVTQRTRGVFAALQCGGWGAPERSQGQIKVGFNGAGALDL